MGWLNSLIGKAAALPDAPVPVARGAAPADNVHHEYFLDDEPENGRWGWLCRVYAHDGTPHQMTGAEESPEQAQAAALTWADQKKRELRGIQ